MQRRAKPLPTQEYIRASLIYDAENGIFVWRHRPDMPPNWNARRSGKKAGAIADNGYLVLGICGGVFKAHRVAWVYIYGDVLGPMDDIDHIDGNPGNNAIYNLRVSDHKQNMANRKRSKNKDTPKGVYKERGRYRAIIRVNNKAISLGTYATVNEAQDAYTVAAKAHWGEFSRIC